MQEKINQIIAMLKFLRKTDFPIPAFGCPFPFSLEVSGAFRPEKVWRINEKGKLSYKGLGYHKSRVFLPDIYIDNIEPTEHYTSYIDVAHTFLADDCAKIVRGHARLSDIPNLDLVMKALYDLGFLNDNIAS